MQSFLYILVFLALVSCTHQKVAVSTTGVPRTRPPLPTVFNGALHASQRDLKDEQGNVVVLRGFGLGGWLFPEGYMLGLPEGKDSPRSIRAAIAEKIGEQETTAFFERYERAYVTQADISNIASWGFNSVRLPLNANQLMPEREQPAQPPFVYDSSRLAQIDQLVRWCKKSGLYVILDLHAAPGAQSRHNIADSDGEARLWTEPKKYWPRTIDFWTNIARRYAAESHVIGYDLLNEPMVNGSEIGTTGKSHGPWSKHDNRPLRQLYMAVTNALRNIGDHKILFVEGGFWGQNFKELTPPWDDNLVYTFHVYPPPTRAAWFIGAETAASFQPVFDAHVPLWLGETGEWQQHELTKREDWLQYNAQMVEFLRTANQGHEVGWSWWTTKKLKRDTQPWHCDFPSSYLNLLARWDETSPRAATRALHDLTDALETSRCRFRSDLVKALGGTGPLSRRP